MVTMSILLIILVITFIFILGAGLLFLQMFSQKQAVSQTRPDEKTDQTEKSGEKGGIRWSYIILPLVLLFVSAGIVIYFYGKLPDEVDWRLNANGSLIGRNDIIMWALVPQLLMTLMAIIISYGTTRISNMFNQTSNDSVKVDAIMIVMSNMVVIPQLILLFAMLRIFNYNVFHKRIGFIWWIAIAIIIVGLVFLTIFFIRTIRKLRAKPNNV
jgi:hypothetical protein